MIIKEYRSGETVVSATVEFSVLPDRKHVQMCLHFDGDPEVVREWLRFSYCRELKWMVHAMQGDSSQVWMSTVNLEGE